MNDSSRSKLIQLCATLSVNLAIICVGMQYVWTSPAIPLLNQTIPIMNNFTMASSFITEVLYLTGALVAPPLTIFSADYFGRKLAILLSSSIALSGWLMIALARRVTLLYIARFISGLASGIILVSTPMYIAEISQPNLRGLLTGSFFITMYFGILLVNILVPYTSLEITAYIAVGLLGLNLVTLPFFHESPYYLLVKNKVEMCRKSLKIYRGSKSVEEEFVELTKFIEDQESRPPNAIELFREPSNRTGIMIVTVLNASQPFSGIIFVLMNLHLILDKTHTEISSDIASIIISLALLLGASIGIGIIDLCGRRTLLITSMFLTSVSILSLGFFFLDQEFNYNIFTFEWIPIISLTCFTFFYIIGLGIVPVILVSELLAKNVRPIAMILSEMAVNIFGCISVMIFYIFGNSIGSYCPFFMSGVWTLVITFFSVFYIPETKNKELEEIQFVLNRVPSIALNKLWEEHVYENNRHPTRMLLEEED